MLELTAHLLGKITERVVFVGGCATGLLITDSARPPVRATKDVDVIVAVTSILGYYDIEKDLRKAGFSQTIAMVDSPICRWTHGELKLDVMPTEEKILGFSNRWYSDAVRTATIECLPNSQEIRLITSPYFLATKIEAFHGRGNGDYRASHDMEDIITIVDGRPELHEEILKSELPLQDYIADEIDAFLGEPSFSDALPCHLAPDASNQARVPIIFERFRALARL